MYTPTNRVTLPQVNVFKDPITDHGKKSKRGRLTLEKTRDGYDTVEEGHGDPRNVGRSSVHKL